jgi:uncharacterized protein (TIGR02246 family)
MANLSIPANVRDAIAAANQDFMSAARAGDAAGLAALYTEDGKILPPNGDFVAGRQAIQGFWQAVLGSGIKGAKLASVEVESHGDTAIEVGKYALYGGEGQELDQGKYIVIWKHEHGHWKLHRDIFNSSNPAPGQ